MPNIEGCITLPKRCKRLFKTIRIFQTANYVVRSEGKNNSLLFKTMARRASPGRTLQNYQSSLTISLGDLSLPAQETFFSSLV